MGSRSEPLGKDGVMDDAFPAPPIKGSRRLVPIRSWSEMFREVQVTGVEFEEFWYASVEDEVAYFFRWLGEPRCTVLVIWQDEGPTHVECRTLGDVEVLGSDAVFIAAEVAYLFRAAGFGWIGVLH